MSILYDYYILEEIFKNGYRPLIITAEINSNCFASI